MSVEPSTFPKLAFVLAFSHWDQNVQQKQLRGKDYWGGGASCFREFRLWLHFLYTWEEHRAGKEPVTDKGCSRHGGPGNGEQDLK